VKLLKKLALIGRTVTYLRWEQVAYRLLRLFQFGLYRRLPFTARRWTLPGKTCPEISFEFLCEFRRVFVEQFAHWSVSWQGVASRLSDFESGQFTFLNQKIALPEPDWNKRYISHLWNYQLHYQDYVVWAARAWVENDDALAWLRARQLIESWSTKARIGISDGWDAYPTSLRIVHWLYAYALVAERDSDKEFLQRWRTNIYWQLDFLYWHLEKHLLANHLFKNIKALVIGGLFFAADKRGQRWLRAGERWLARELEEQVLPDGGHYERTPMYHAQTLSDALECYALLICAGRVSVDGTMRQRILQMADFLEALSYSDGTLALFNDSANTLETRPQPLLESVRRICGERNHSRPTSFAESGYYGWQSPDGREKIVVDAGEPSVSYNTAHAHCDMLSYELWLNGAPFIVDSGIHGYGGDEFREYCRSTRAHNTMMLDNIEQSEVWGTFRMARRAKLISAVAESEVEQWRFTGEYKDFTGSSALYRRQITRSQDKSWEVRDKVSLQPGEKGLPVIRSFIHLHPAVKAEKENNGVVCHTTQGKILIEPFGFAQCALEKGVPLPNAQGWYFPDLGVALPSVTITFQHKMNNYDNAQGVGYRIKPC
jgi:uncharacterized heparinase superfamily protein